MPFCLFVSDYDEFRVLLRKENRAGNVIEAIMATRDMGYRIGGDFTDSVLQYMGN